MSREVNIFIIIISVLQLQSHRVCMSLAIWRIGRGKERQTLAYWIGEKLLAHFSQPGQSEHDLILLFLHSVGS